MHATIPKGNLGPVSQKSRKLLGPFRVRQFPLCLCNAEVLSHETSQSSWFFLRKSMLKDEPFKTRGLQFDNWLFGPEKFLRLSRNRPEWDVINSFSGTEVV